MHDFLTVGAAHPLQIAGVTALGLPQTYYDDLAASYAAKRDILLSGLEAAGFRCHRPDSAYYIMADFTDVRSDLDDTEFAMWLTKEVGVTAIPGSSFYADKALGARMVRFAYPKKDATLHAAVERLAAARSLTA